MHRQKQRGPSIRLLSVLICCRECSPQEDMFYATSLSTGTSDDMLAKQYLNRQLPGKRYLSLSRGRHRPHTKNINGRWREGDGGSTQHWRLPFLHKLPSSVRFVFRPHPTNAICSLSNHIRTHLKANYSNEKRNTPWWPQPFSFSSLSSVLSSSSRPHQLPTLSRLNGVIPLILTAIGLQPLVGLVQSLSRTALQSSSATSAKLLTLLYAIVPTLVELSFPSH